MIRSRFQFAAIVLFAVLLATNFYRAATQSIVHDEGLTWVEYLAGPASLIFQTYDANNHFLASILFKISVTLFGDSEFALRLPTVLAGAWFFWTLLRLSALLFGDSWLFLLACAAIALNPILLDFLVAARGYGLAMAGLFWGFYQMLAWVDETGRGIGEAQIRKRLWKAAAGMSIAVAANLTFLMPVVAMAGAFCALLVRAAKQVTVQEPAPTAAARKKSKKGRPKASPQTAHRYASVMHFIVPIVLFAAAFLIAAPIDKAHTQDFYAGQHSALASLQDLVRVSFGYGDSAGPMQRIEKFWTSFALFFLPLIAATALIVSLVTQRLLRSVVGVATLFASLAVVGPAILLGVAHLAVGIPYPEDRTGIYFVPLATLAALGLSWILANRGGLLRYTGIAIALVLATFAVEFAAQWNVKTFWVWRYDADSRQIFDKLEAMPRPANVGPEQIRVGASWIYDPSLNFYRVVRNAYWMAPLVRDGFGGMRDYYVISPEDQVIAKLPRMKQIYKGPLSGTVLAIPQ